MRSQLLFLNYQRKSLKAFFHSTSTVEPQQETVALNPSRKTIGNSMFSRNKPIQTAPQSIIFDLQILQ